MRKIMFFLVLSLFCIGFASAQCAFESVCGDPDIRGAAFSFEVEENYCHYGDSDLQSRCYYFNDPWDQFSFYDNTCLDASCMQQCRNCDFEGKDCNFFRNGLGEVIDCENDDCDCPQPGLGQQGEDEEEIPESNTTAIIIMLVAVAGAGVMILKKR